MDRDATPQTPRIGVIVGEGHRARRGLLRFVLEGEGFLVLADASTAAELVQALAVHRPDAVVLDDGIGSTAVVLTREMCPDAKIVLVWPRDLAPINGDATVDPRQVLRDLGPAVERACGLPAAAPEPAIVRQMPRSRPTRRLPRHGVAEVLPGPGIVRPREPSDEAIIVDHEPAPILILPVSPTVERDPRS